LAPAMVDYEKLNWTKTLSKLGKDVLIAERTLGHFLDDDEFSKDRRDLLRFREEYLAKTQKRLQSFKAALGPIKERLDDICSGRAGADVIQPLLESYEKKLTEFKISMRDEFVELENEEVTLSRELQVIASRMEGWMSATDGGPRPDEVERLAEVKGRKEASERRLTDELERQAKIGAIDKQLVTLGGRTGGWDSRDHDAFIRVWTQVGCAPAVRPPPQITNHLAAAASSSSGGARGGGIRSPPKSPQRDGMAVVGNALGGGGAGSSSSSSGGGHGGGDNGHDRDADAAPPGDDDDNDDAPRGSPERKQQAQAPAQGDTKVDEMPVLVISRGHHSALIKRLPVAVPGKTADDFEDHILWYLTYLSLNAEKKKLLARWKEEKMSLEKAEEEALAKQVAFAMRGYNQERQTPEQMMDEAYKVRHNSLLGCKMMPVTDLILCLAGGGRARRNAGQSEAMEGGPREGAQGQGAAGEGPGGAAGQGAGGRLAEAAADDPRAGTVRPLPWRPYRGAPPEHAPTHVLCPLV